MKDSDKIMEQALVNLENGVPDEIEEMLKNMPEIPYKPSLRHRIAMKFILAKARWNTRKYFKRLKREEQSRKR